MKMFFLRFLIFIITFFSPTVFAEKYIPPIFKLFKNLVVQTEKKQKVNYINFGTFPTPVQKLEKLGAVVNHQNLWIKRDDLSGSLFGGNKVRKLEFLLGDALAHQAKGVMTVGYAGSNHTAATAIYAQQHELECYCMHTPQIVTAYFHRNILLSNYYGAKLHHFKQIGERDKAKLDLNKEFKKRTKESLYFIPAGGSNEIGAVGFVNAAFELKEQINAGIFPEPDFIFVACGSTGTAAGLALGIIAAGLKAKIIPIAIAPESYTGALQEKLCNLFALTNIYLTNRDASFPLISFNAESCIIDHNFCGKYYGHITKKVHQAIKILDTTESIKLDGTYSGKAFAAMLEYLTITDFSNKVVLFWDTYFSDSCQNRLQAVDYTQLPEKYHNYFLQPLQILDQGV